MLQINNKYILKIPKKIVIIYCLKKKLLAIKTKSNFSMLKTKVFILLDATKNQIKVTHFSTENISSNEKKKLKAYKGLLIAQIKQIIIESTAKFYKKLQFIGVGYRALPVVKFKNAFSVYTLKLGLSHPMYLNFKSIYLKMHCLKFTKVFIFGTSYWDVSQTAANFRALKKPEPYKGKGIRYHDEHIILKEGKKI